MDISFAAIADAANLTHDGKVNILGMCDTLAVARAPGQVDRVVLVFGIRGEHADVGKPVHITINLIDQDSQVVWAGSAAVKLKDAEPGEFSHLNHVLQFRNLRFPAIGRYRFRIRITGQHKPYDVVFQVLNREKAGS